MRVYPDTRFVRFSNYIDISLKSFDDGRIVIISAIDNLIKGRQVRLSRI